VWKKENVGDFQVAVKERERGNERKQRMKRES